jgi:hypothetical protein
LAQVEEEGIMKRIWYQKGDMLARVKAVGFSAFADLFDAWVEKGLLGEASRRIWGHSIERGKPYFKGIPWVYFCCFSCKKREKRHIERVFRTSEVLHTDG